MCYSILHWTGQRQIWQHQSNFFCGKTRKISKDMKLMINQLGGISNCYIGIPIGLTLSMKSCGFLLSPPPGLYLATTIRPYLLPTAVPTPISREDLQTI